jgi:tetratricopeptide (TPR) repeat protein
MRSPSFDVDSAIVLGEAELADASRSEWARKQTRFDLAALLHHRACVSMEAGAQAIADLERAIAIDPHPEYLTTLALAHERDDTQEAARALHDRAVDAIARVSLTSEEPDADRDARPSFPRRAARSLEARGAFRATHGDREGALADLRASLAMHPSASVERRLAKLGA